MENGPGNSNQNTYLGFDLSTQQLKVIAINDDLESIHEATVNFDADLPEFRTQGGITKGPDHVVTAPTLMWVKALDMVLEKLKISGLDFNTIVSISGSGQQHGSVYWKKGAEDVLKKLDATRFLHDQLQSSFVFRDSPVWMDSSTSDQCRQLESALGGPLELANLTGSRAYERFTGNQIAKIYQNRPDAYKNTERISLVSSFLASLFLGKYASIDWSDGSGMNLLDIRTKSWSQKCVDACAPQLIEKLGEDIVTSWKSLGLISPYFVDRYSFNEKCQVIAFTGDNPASLVGMCLREGDIAISLGTSDTVFLWLKDLNEPHLNGHILCNPIDKDSYMALICFKNGSRTRERIRNECGESNWDLFSELLNSTPRGNFGNIGFYLDFNEIYPVVSGDFRFNKFNERVIKFSKEVEVRACLEGQFLRLRCHAENMGYRIGPESRVLCCGGASVNSSIIQCLSDVFNAPVYIPNRPNSASLGAAYMAKYGLISGTVSFNEMTANIQTFSMSAQPANDSNSIYSQMLTRFRDLEDKLVQMINK